jgi:hypothetical protein
MTVKSICEDAGLSSDFTATVRNTYSEKKASDFNQDGINNRANTSWKRAANIIVSYPPDLSKDKLLGRWKILTDGGRYDGQSLYYPISPEMYEMYDCRGELVDTGELKSILERQNIKKIKNGIGYDVKEASYLAAIRTKPFILLAGISGTGKSRMVRQLARGCCPRFKSGTEENHPLYNEQKPGNFEMIPVRPNWHDSTELMGYVSRISGSPKYVITDFIRFLAKAWLYEKEGIPFFLCLDEMNLAPVEQYFAEFLSVIETRKKDEDGRIVTDTLVKISDEPLLKSVIDDVYKDVEHNAAENFKAFFVSTGGLPIPSNLVVMGTVNMDETTCTFSRKVLDRAMSFELNDVSDMYDLSNIEDEGDYEFGSIDSAAAKQSLTTGKEACDTAKDICGKVLGYLKAVNEKLDKTAFKIAYRSRNEIMIYCLERINGDVLSLAEALDEATSMKILSRIEGDSQHVTEKWLGELSELISAELAKVDGYDESKCNICRDKLNDMKGQVQSGYTSFWMR